MNRLKTIREYYKPIQPTVSGNDNDISYQEIPPNKEIEDYFFCFWQLKTKNILNHDYNYRVVSDFSNFIKSVIKPSGSFEITTKSLNKKTIEFSRIPTVDYDPIYLPSIPGTWKILEVFFILIPKRPIIKRMGLYRIFLCYVQNSHFPFGNWSTINRSNSSLILLLFTILSWYFRSESIKITL